MKAEWIVIRANTKHRIILDMLEIAKGKYKNSKLRLQKCKGEITLNHRQASTFCHAVEELPKCGHALNILNYQNSVFTHLF